MSESERTYKIGEAAQHLNLKSYVLRFWETEFPQLNPLRTEKGQRLYTEADIELLKLIRHLLHERGLTIEGARKVLQSRDEGIDLEMTGELLDESYKDFGGEGIIPPPVEISAATPHPLTAGDTASASQAAQMAAQKIVLEHTLQELKEIETLLRNPEKHR